MKKDKQHQGEPVALPERKTLADSRNHDMPVDINNSMVTGWNACLDEVAKLGPLYPHADPGEVERLRNAVEFYCKLSNEMIGERDNLRADVESMRRKNNEYWHETETLHTQLAERDALLREVIDGKTRTQFDGDLMHRILMALSASAELKENNDEH